MATKTAAAKAVSVDLPAEIFLAIEKPFGTDQQSAQAFNALLGRLRLPESHIFRVDHYLGKPYQEEELLALISSYAAVRTAV